MDGAMGSQATSPAIANHSHLIGLLYAAEAARKPVTNTCDGYHSVASSRGLPPFSTAQSPPRLNRIPQDALTGRPPSFNSHLRHVRRQAKGVAQHRSPPRRKLQRVHVHFLFTSSELPWPTITLPPAAHTPAIAAIPTAIRPTSADLRHGWDCGPAGLQPL